MKIDNIYDALDWILIMVSGSILIGTFFLIGFGTGQLWGC